jgi:hypothetical protein
LFENIGDFPNLWCGVGENGPLCVTVWGGVSGGKAFAVFFTLVFVRG